MVEPSRAVFLSYASEDAAAAWRIATTLRGAGVEVWFAGHGGTLGALTAQVLADARVGLNK